MIKPEKISFKAPGFPDWLAGLLLLGIYLSMNGYTYAWDDQHLEIPLLKHLIDPRLYAGDYYVESLSRHFSSLLYPLLARFITVAQIPGVYFGLYITSRYFFFYWAYKLWRHLSRSKLTGFLCVAAILSIGRVEELLYRTFSHQEFALAIVFAGIYLFYKSRFILSAFVLGIAANFHSLYSLFPYLYMLFYLTVHFGRYGGRTTFKTSLAFLLGLIPLLLWMKGHPHTATSGPAPRLDEWVPLYQLACPQNFIFVDIDLKGLMTHMDLFLRGTSPYWPLLVMYALNRFYNPLFRRDKKTGAVLLCGLLFLLISFVFTYMIPKRFVLDLNLIRNTQYMLFFLTGYTVILLTRCSSQNKTGWVFLLSLCIPLMRFDGYIRSLALLIMLAVCGLQEIGFPARKRGEKIKAGILFGLAALALTGLAAVFHFQKFSSAVMLTLYLIWGMLAFNYLMLLFWRAAKAQTFLRALFVVIPLAVFSAHYMMYHYNRITIEKTGTGFWQLQRNWEDMQRYVREHTPPDATLLVPYDMTMGGFRILSERKIVCSYRDCGIVGFDFQAAREWQRRVKDIEPFKVIARQDITPAIQNAVLKYHVQYIVFMNYLAPPPNTLLTFLYRNDVFSLYQINVSPGHRP